MARTAKNTTTTAPAPASTEPKRQVSIPDSIDFDSFLSSLEQISVEKRGKKADPNSARQRALKLITSDPRVVERIYNLHRNKKLKVVSLISELESKHKMVIDSSIANFIISEIYKLNNDDKKNPKPVD